MSLLTWQHYPGGSLRSTQQLQEFSAGLGYHTWAGMAQKLINLPWVGGDSGEGAGEGSHHVEKPC